MFPARQQTTANSSPLNVYAEDNDWLSVGKSFPGNKRKEKSEPNATDSSAFALQVCKKSRHRKHKKDEKKIRKNKEKKRHRKELTNVSLSKPKKKKKSEKRKRSWSLSSSSDEYSPDPSNHRSRRCESRNFNRENETKPKDLVAYGQEAKDQEEKLFEIDCTGDRDNLFFGSMYAYDQQLYQLATRRDLLTGAWVTHAPPKHTVSKVLEESYDSGRYFSQLARKMETNGRQKRFYLAYSEKRLANARASGKFSRFQQKNQPASQAGSRQDEMTFIPLDPVLDSDELLCTHADSPNGIIDQVPVLTDGQSVEQHLMERSKRLNAAVFASPHCIDRWLDLIVFQEETILLQTESKKVTAAMKTSIVDKQAAILAKALATNPASRELHCLKLNMSLQALANGNDSDIDAFQRQLETLIAKDVTNSELWLKLLESRHQRFGTFSMQSVRNLYARTLTVLRNHSTCRTSKSATRARSTLRLSESAKPAEEVSTTLLDFHFLMCLFENKTGYVERAIAQLQALFVFSMMFEQSDCKEGHVDMVRKFALRWNDPGTIRLGDKRNEEMDVNIGADPPELSMTAFQDFIEKNCITTMDQVNPPAILRSEEHKQKLLSSAAVYQSQSRIKESLNNEDCEGITNDMFDLNPTKSADVDNVEMTLNRTLVYSSLHGYRITIDQASDVKEYERILSDLRGTDDARARRARVVEKEKKKCAVRTASKVEIEDQRANYRPVGTSDRFLQWLVHEQVKMQTEWASLHCNNPLHQDLIEQQPDRAILTEEVQPFLFAVPSTQWWRLLAELLYICGVDWRGEHSWETRLAACESMYADNYTDYELFVAPIQAALDPQRAQSWKHTLFLSPSDRVKLLEHALLCDIRVKEEVLHDPSKVTFIRRIFAQAVEIFNEFDKQFESTLKGLWIEFEATIARSVAEREESVAYARRLSQHLAPKSANGDTDFNVLYAYAKLELSMGNERQVRRICETTLASLGTQSPYNASLAQAIHRFVFLNARLEMWPSSCKKTTKTPVDRDLRMLRCLYTLWRVWQPAHKETKPLSMIAKKYQKQTKDYLQKLLMLDLSIETTLTAKYRDEFKLAVEHCAASRLATQKHDKVKLSSPDEPSCWVGYCLHNLALVIYAYHGLEAACQEVRKGLDHVDHQLCPQVAWAWTCLLDLMQQHQVAGSFPILAPRQWRLTVSAAVEMYPYNELFLRLFVDSEVGNTISQVHRQYFDRVEKRWRRHYDSPKLVEWLFALLCEFCRSERTAMIRYLAANDDSVSRPTCCLRHHWAMNTTAIHRIRHIFENMVNQIQTKGNALCWGLYMRFEMALGSVDAAKKVLYRGIAACAWSKALYMDGLRVMRAYLSEEECQELLDFMEAKELNVRVEMDDSWM